MRNANGDMRARNSNSTLDTIHAAATAIAAIEDRASEAEVVQKRRWGGCWSFYWCFGSSSYKQRKRIGHAVFVPEVANLSSSAPAAQNQIQSTAILLPFIAPPSSPASIFQSEPPSATQSPTGLVSLAPVPPGMFSPSSPHSIFAIGPYAHETQLVSPPVFSAFTTEPSTAPFTPPPESVHLTTPSSPEVPFAKLLNPNFKNGDTSFGFPFSYYDFPFYQLSPGSPVGHLISPGSVISGSGTSSPFPGREFSAIDPNFLDFLSNGTPKLLALEKRSNHEWRSRPDSGSLTPDPARIQPPDAVPQDCQVSSMPEVVEECQDTKSNGLANRRVSFELPAEEVVRTILREATTSSESTIAEREGVCSEAQNGNEGHESEKTVHTPEGVPADGEKKRQHWRRRSITLGSSREFDFENVDGDDSTKPRIGAAWSANEKVVEEDENGPTNNWSFPVIQSSNS